MRVFAVYGFVPTLVWLGFVLAISFMEAPLKFRAAGVSRSQALAVGRVVFRALNLVESMLLLIVLAGLPGESSRARMTVSLLAGLFALQQLVLRWPLDRYIAKSVAEGGSASRRVTHLHRVYVFLEIIKVLGLVVLFNAQLQEFPGQ
jgi:hypothetical protein